MAWRYSRWFNGMRLVVHMEFLHDVVCGLSYSMAFALHLSHCIGIWSYVAASSRDRTGTTSFFDAASYYYWVWRQETWHLQYGIGIISHSMAYGVMSLLLAATYRYNIIYRCEFIPCWVWRQETWHLHCICIMILNYGIFVLDSVFGGDSEKRCFSMAWWWSVFILHMKYLFHLLYLMDYHWFTFNWKIKSMLNWTCSLNSLLKQFTCWDIWSHTHFYLSRYLSGFAWRVGK